ncbi:hypothetical protein JZU61_04380 [bacterium]|jgi:hypothetical protein|nr:hypothetical protein [bacterium]
MAKKQEEKILIDCLKCEFCGGEVVNIMVDCSNKLRNPGGFKVGYWKRECRYFKQKR